jgi:hypothetical protein
MGVIKDLINDEKFIISISISVMSIGCLVRGFNWFLSDEMLYIAMIIILLIKLGILVSYYIGDIKWK